MNCSLQHKDYDSENLFTWCTNCGNYGINGALKEALVEECIKPSEVVLVFDIGCNGNGSDKLNGYTVHGLHGRAIPFACGAAIANTEIPVIASAGDGATMSEGIGHLVAAIRGNYNITFLLHNNSNYGLTTGQASATTPEGFPMNSSPDGVNSTPIHVLDFVFALKPTFVARGYSGNTKQLTSIMRDAINHKGFSFVEILQDCPTYNKATSHEWFLERVYDVAGIMNYNRSDRARAQLIARDIDSKIATGVLYQSDESDFMTKLENRVDLGESTLVNEVKQYNPDVIFSRFA